MELTQEQLEMKLMILAMTLGVIAKNERSCPDIFTAREMAARALERADAHVTAPPPADIFEAYGLSDGDVAIDATGGEVRETTVGALRDEHLG